MPKFSEKSEQKLKECDAELQNLFAEVVKYFDCTVLCGMRNEVDQNIAFKSGRSKLLYPDSKHNKIPSRAIDAIPYPINWYDVKRIYMFIGFVLGTAQQMGINIKSGADWNMNTEVSDNIFNDLTHFELI